MKYLFFAITFSFTLLLPAQNGVMSFDGIDDYIDLGDSVANGVRTIEMWFQPGTDIDSNLNDFSYLLVREIAAVNSNEFNLLFLSSSSADAGALNFVIRNGNNTPFYIVSDVRIWDSSQWYHVAAVVDPVKGMMLFVDGVKQTDTNSSTIPITSVMNSTTLGGTTVFSDRYFHGNIDDVRFSTSAEYTSNFTPTCPDLKATSSTVGLWNFNDSTAVDSSGNSNDGIIHGTVRGTATICTSIISSIVDNKFIEQSAILMYPNPSSGRFSFDFNGVKGIGQKATLKVYDYSGKLIEYALVNGNKGIIDLSDFSNGIYFYQLILEDQKRYSGKLIKQ